jgi:hypothetical protein
MPIAKPTRCETTEGRTIFLLGRLSEGRSDMVYLKGLCAGFVAFTIYVLLLSVFFFFSAGFFHILLGEGGIGVFAVSGSRVMVFAAMGLLIFAAGFGWQYRRASRRAGSI